MKIIPTDLKMDLGIPEGDGERLARIFETMENLASTPRSNLHLLKNTRVNAALILTYAQAKVRSAQWGSLIPTIRDLVADLRCSSDFASRLVRIFATLQNLLETSPEDLQTLMNCDVTRVELIRAYARLVIRGDHGTPMDEPRVLRGRLGLAPKYADRLVGWFSTWQNLAATSPDDLVILVGPTQLAGRILAYARLKLLPEHGTQPDESTLRAFLGLSPSYIRELVELFKTVENLAATSAVDLQALTSCNPATAAKIVAYAQVKVRA